VLARVCYLDTAYTILFAFTGRGAARGLELILLRRVICTSLTLLAYFPSLRDSRGLSDLILNLSDYFCTADVGFLKKPSAVTC
jgi:hypothetical protein